MSTARKMIAKLTRLMKSPSLSSPPTRRRQTQGVGKAVRRAYLSNNSFSATVASGMKTKGKSLMMNRYLCSVAVMLCLAASSALHAQGVYHNQRVFVVPTPGKVVMDGDLEDWDLSGEILTYVVEASMDYQSARTAFMYDNEALYISGRVADPTPMLNQADPAVNPDFGWDGDAFQLRLALDPALGYPLKIGGYDRHPSDMLVHMTLWHYTGSGKPVLHLKYGMDYHDAHGYHKGVVPADKFAAVYKKWDDGKGFTFEYRIPWSTLARRGRSRAAT